MSIQNTVHNDEVAETSNQLPMSKLAAIVAAIALLAAVYNTGPTASTPGVVETEPTPAIAPVAGTLYYDSSTGSSLDTENSFSW